VAIFGRVSDACTDLRVPKCLRDEVGQVFALTDGFCEEHLDGEYADLCRRLVAKLARKRPSPLARGDLRIWAAAAIYTVGQCNFLFDQTQALHLTGDDLSALTGVPKSTMANKASLIRRSLGLQPLDVEFCRHDILVRHPTAWLIDLDGFIVDARAMPAHIQAEAQRRGLIPVVPARAIG